MHLSTAFELDTICNYLLLVGNILIFTSALFIYIAGFLISAASAGEGKTRQGMEHTISKSFTLHHTSEIKKCCTAMFFCQSNGKLQGFCTLLSKGSDFLLKHCPPKNDHLETFPCLNATVNISHW